MMKVDVFVKIKEIYEKLKEITEEIDEAFANNKVITAQFNYSSGHACSNANSKIQYVKYIDKNGNIKEVELVTIRDNGYYPGFRFVEITLTINDKEYKYEKEAWNYNPLFDSEEEEKIVNEILEWELFDKETNGFYTTWFQKDTINYGSSESVYSPVLRKIADYLDEKISETDGDEETIHYIIEINSKQDIEYAKQVINKIKQLIKETLEEFKEFKDEIKMPKITVEIDEEFSYSIEEITPEDIEQAETEVRIYLPF